MKDGGVAPEVLQYEKDDGVVVGRRRFSAVRLARISLSRRSCLDSWRRCTAQRVSLTRPAAASSTSAA